jgi:hypothetical protein
MAQVMGELTILKSHGVQVVMTSLRAVHCLRRMMRAEDEPLFQSTDNYQVGGGEKLFEPCAANNLG